MVIGRLSARPRFEGAAWGCIRISSAPPGDAIGEARLRRLFEPPRRVYVELLLAAMHLAVVKLDHGPGMADPAVARRVVLHGVAVRCVRATSVITCACVVGVASPLG